MKSCLPLCLAAAFYVSSVEKQLSSVRSRLMPAGVGQGYQQIPLC